MEEKKSPNIFSSSQKKGYRTMASGWQWSTLFQEIRCRELVSKPAISFKKSRGGGATVERLKNHTAKKQGLKFRRFGVKELRRSETTV